MRIAYELCLATAGKQVPSGPDWIHEVKHDGYRMLVIRESERVRLLSRNGSDWTRRYPWIVEAALKNRQKHWKIPITGPRGRQGAMADRRQKGRRNAGLLGR